MSKKLPATNMVNELAGSSVFFQPPGGAKKQKETQPQRDENPIPIRQKQSPSATKDMLGIHATTASSNRDTTQPRSHETEKPAGHPSTIPVNHDLALTPSPDGSAQMLMEVRKVVKQLGKEAATHRFTEQEKHAIADLVYTYNRQGYRTSENEITRIAVNWLLIDFKDRGEQSILARMLELLHA